MKIALLQRNEKKKATQHYVLCSTQSLTKKSILSEKMRVRAFLVYFFFCTHIKLDYLHNKKIALWYSFFSYLLSSLLPLHVLFCCLCYAPFFRSSYAEVNIIIIFFSFFLHSNHNTFFISSIQFMFVGLVDARLRLYIASKKKD